MTFNQKAGPNSCIRGKQVEFLVGIKTLKII
jgi:hypothetical protein